MNQAPETLIAFDYGTKRIGSAVGKRITQTARPLTTIKVTEGEIDWNALSKLIQEWQPDAFIIGLPLNMDGSEQDITQEAKSFAKALEKKFELPIFFIDERLTTKAAREMVFNQGGYKALQKTEIDCIAAMLILEQWFQEQ